MKAYVTSIGEPTKELCLWALKRNGFKTVLIENETSLASKLKFIYDHASEDFVRIDADVIVNKDFTPELMRNIQASIEDVWWWQFQVFDWLKLDLTHSIGFIRQEALPALRLNVDRFLNSNRAETELSRVKEFYEPRRFATYNLGIMGIHGYKTNLKAAKEMKKKRNQLINYDFEMAERLNAL